MIFRSDWDKQKGASVSEHLFVFVRFCHFSGINLNPPFARGRGMFHWLCFHALGCWSYAESTSPWPPSQGGGLRYVLEILPPFGRLDDNQGRYKEMRISSIIVIQSEAKNLGCIN